MDLCLHLATLQDVSDATMYHSQNFGRYLLSNGQTENKTLNVRVYTEGSSEVQDAKLTYSDLNQLLNLLYSSLSQWYDLKEDYPKQFAASRIGRWVLDSSGKRGPISCYFEEPTEGRLNLTLKKMTEMFSESFNSIIRTSNEEETKIQNENIQNIRQILIIMIKNLGPAESNFLDHVATQCGVAKVIRFYAFKESDDLIDASDILTKISVSNLKLLPLESYVSCLVYLYYRMSHEVGKYNPMLTILYNVQQFLIYQNLGLVGMSEFLTSQMNRAKGVLYDDDPPAFDHLFGCIQSTSYAQHAERSTRYKLDRIKKMTMEELTVRELHRIFFDTQEVIDFKVKFQRYFEQFGARFGTLIFNQWFAWLLFAGAKRYRAAIQLTLRTIHPDALLEEGDKRISLLVQLIDSISRVTENRPHPTLPLSPLDTMAWLNENSDLLQHIAALSAGDYAKDAGVQSMSGLLSPM